MSAKILVVDDHDDVREMLTRVLTEHGFDPLTAASGNEALVRDRNEEPDLILLDVVLPDIDGFEVLRRVRTRTTKPVIMLTVRDGEADRVVGLELGADDYVTKPFAPRELIARLRARLRRVQEYAPSLRDADVLDFGTIKIDAVHREVVANGKKRLLTPKESDLLHLLAANEGRVVPRQVLLQNVWGYNSQMRTRTLDVHIQRLRRKLGTGLSLPRLIITVPNVGYRFQAPAGSEALGGDLT
ncbi:MAG: response regulator transcription factor [Armatimonadota bacterium]